MTAYTVISPMFVGAHQDMAAVQAPSYPPPWPVVHILPSPHNTHKWMAGAHHGVAAAHGRSGGGPAIGEPVQYNVLERLWAAGWARWVSRIWDQQAPRESSDTIAHIVTYIAGLGGLLQAGLCAMWALPCPFACERPPPTNRCPNPLLTLSFPRA